MSKNVTIASIVDYLINVEAMLTILTPRSINLCNFNKKEITLD